MFQKRLFALIVSYSLIFSSIAIAEDENKAEAKRHFENGVTMQELEDFDGAVVEYEASVKLYQTQNALFNLAMCYKALHNYNKALQTFRSILKFYGKKLSPEVGAEVQKNIKLIKKMVAKVEITANISQAVVTVDGEQIGMTPLAAPMVVGAGAHRIRVSADGYGTQEKKISVVAGKSQVVDFTMAPAAAAPTPGVVPGPVTPAGPSEEQVKVEKALGKDMTRDYRAFKRRRESEKMTYAAYQYGLAGKKFKRGLLTLTVGSPILIGAGLAFFFGIEQAKNDPGYYGLTSSQRAENNGLDVIRYLLMALCDAAAVVTISVGSVQLARGKKNMSRLEPLVTAEQGEAAPGEASDGAAKEEATPDKTEPIGDEPETVKKSAVSQFRFIGVSPMLDQGGAPAGAAVSFRF